MTATAAPLGLICAIPEEIAHFGEVIAAGTSRSLGGLVFHVGALDGHPLVLVESGIGKVNAAMVATLLCQVFGCRALLFSGVAGGLDPALGVGDVVIADRLVQHDYGALVDGVILAYQPGAPPLPGFPRDAVGYRPDPAVMATVAAALDGVQLPPFGALATGAAPRQPVIRFGTIVSGDTFLNCARTRDRLHAEFGAMAVEMEGAAVAQVAERFGVPYVVVRSLSDLAGAESHLDFPSFASAAAAGAAVLIRRLLPVLAR